jgi:hypothetical protein
MKAIMSSAPPHRTGSASGIMATPVWSVKPAAPPLQRYVSA